MKSFCWKTGFSGTFSPLPGFGPRQPATSMSEAASVKGARIALTIIRGHR
jgi:hypothetical protein